MVGFQYLLKNKKKHGVYTALLNEVLTEVAAEQKRIEAGYSSGWTLDQLNKVIIPEILELLYHAQMGELFFKYGQKQRMLESTYLLLDSCDNLNATQLGKKIIDLQDLYSKI